LSLAEFGLGTWELGHALLDTLALFCHVVFGLKTLFDSDWFQESWLGKWILCLRLCIDINGTLKLGDTVDNTTADERSNEMIAKNTHGLVEYDKKGATWTILNKDDPRFMKYDGIQSKHHPSIMTYYDFLQEIKYPKDKKAVKNAAYGFTDDGEVGASEQKTEKALARLLHQGNATFPSALRWLEKMWKKRIILSFDTFGVDAGSLVDDLKTSGFDANFQFIKLVYAPQHDPLCSWVEPPSSEQKSQESTEVKAPERKGSNKPAQVQSYIEFFDTMVTKIFYDPKPFVVIVQHDYSRWESHQKNPKYGKRAITDGVLKPFWWVIVRTIIVDDVANAWHCEFGSKFVHVNTVLAALDDQYFLRVGNPPSLYEEPMFWFYVLAIWILMMFFYSVWPFGALLVILVSTWMVSGF
jgi:hypothetical protein